MVIRSVAFVAFLALLAARSSATADADATGGTSEKPSAFTPLIDLRLRAEQVDQAGFSEDAQAVTLRGRVGFETSKRLDTVLLAEGELLWPLTTRYNDSLNGNVGFPIVLDPESHELNRLQLTNTVLPDTHIIAGRQRITLDDHRFVGNVGWRQNEQTFDALRVVNRSVPDLSIDLAWVDQVNRVQGSGSPVGRYHGDSLLANVAYSMPLATATAFAYVLQFDEAPADSTRTIGLKLAGRQDAGRFALAANAAYARQRDHSANPLTFHADWYSLDFTAKYGHVSVGAGREILTGDGVKGFSTPIATLHAFQGWADQFVQTPPNGIDDRWAQLGYVAHRAAGFERLLATVVYHDFHGQRLGEPYGSELDVLVRAEGKRVRCALKLADFQTKGWSRDTRKFWAEIEFVW